MSPSPAVPAFRSILVLCVVLAACSGRAGPGGTATQGGVVDRLAPARTLRDSLQQGIIEVASATLTPLSPSGSGARVRLAISFQPRPGASRITIRPDRRDIVLRDDGGGGDSLARDGVFSALIELSGPQLDSELSVLRSFDSGGRRAALFRGREQLPPPRLDSALLVDARILTTRRTPIPLIILTTPVVNLAARSLMVTDPAVVRDPARTFDVCTGTGTPMGKWTFGYLMTEMANTAATGLTPSQFARQWVDQWMTPQVVNGFTIPAKTTIDPSIIQPWLAASGGTGELDLAQAPFRLLAIVNRVDLRQNLVYGGGSAGEARFVFGALDRRNGGCTSMEFTVIFEYGIVKNSCSAVKAWGKQWFDLSTMAPSSAAYRDALQAITEQFVPAGSAPSQLPNQNALNQLRTNEIALSPPWELREFVLGSSGHLGSATVKQEPDRSYALMPALTPALISWINANSAAIAAGKHRVPDLLNGAPFLGARAPVPSPGFIWNHGSLIPTSNARHMFSLNTCSGCHAGETRTSFTHVKPNAIPAPLSGFLTGITVVDPDPTDADNSSRTFADLARREADLDALVNRTCLRQVAFNNISRFVH